MLDGSIIATIISDPARGEQRRLDRPGAVPPRVVAEVRPYGERAQRDEARSTPSARSAASAAPRTARSRRAEARQVSTARTSAASVREAEVALEGVVAGRGRRSGCRACSPSRVTWLDLVA